MKQEIICSKCELETRMQFPTADPYPGEHVKFVTGITKKNFKCDYCDTDIPKDITACAFSIWADYGGVPYYEWESAFLKINQ
jgi:hypothetical protein